MRQTNVKKIHPATPSLLRKPAINPIGQMRPPVQSLQQPNEMILTEAAGASTAKRPNCPPAQRPAVHQPDKMNRRIVKSSSGGAQADELSQLLSKTKTAPKMVATAKRSIPNPEIVHSSAPTASRVDLTKRDEASTFLPPEARGVTVSKRFVQNAGMTNPPSLTTARVALAKQDEASAFASPDVFDTDADTVSSSPSTPVSKKRVAHPTKRPHPEPIECFPVVPCKKRNKTPANDVTENLKPLGVVKPQTIISPRRSSGTTVKSSIGTQLESTSIDTGSKTKMVDIVVQLLELCQFNCSSITT